jgi:hypothetical protein
MKNTTTKNHSKIIKLLKELKVSTTFYKFSSLNESYIKENISIDELYFAVIKENNLSNIKDIMYFFFDDYFYLIDCGELKDCPLSKEDMLIIISFIENNFEENEFLNFEVFNNKKLFGDFRHLNIERALNRKLKNKEEKLYLQPYNKYKEKDYATAIEIETIICNAVPFVRINECSSGYLFTMNSETDEKFFFKKFLEYDIKAYGSHYL